MSQTIQQQRAKYALEKVEALNKVQKSHFVSYASELPSMIHMNGLGQAMTFNKAKGVGKDEKAMSRKALYNIVSEWVCKKPGIYSQHTDILEGITQQSMHDYQLAQTETLLLMGWVKKFAKAFIIEEEEK